MRGDAGFIAGFCSGSGERICPVPRAWQGGCQGQPLASVPLASVEVSGIDPGAGSGVPGDGLSGRARIQRRQDIAPVAPAVCPAALEQVRAQVLLEFTLPDDEIQLLATVHGSVE